jgi:hypothetical protein
VGPSHSLLALYSSQHSILEGMWLTLAECMISAGEEKKAFFSTGQWMCKQALHGGEAKPCKKYGRVVFIGPTGQRGFRDAFRCARPAFLFEQLSNSRLLTPCKRQDKTPGKRTREVRQVVMCISWEPVHGVQHAFWAYGCSAVPERTRARVTLQHES